MNQIVVIGGGQAGYQVCASLRQEGFAGDITLIGDEPGGPYQRPPLSKGYLQGKMEAQALRFRAPEWYAQQRVDCVQARVARIDRDARSVQLADGARIAYDHLVLATGARNRVPALAGIGLDGVLGLRSLADADSLLACLPSAHNIVVIGAGFIGLEFAATASGLGKKVVVLEVATRPMARAITPAMSALFTAGHAALGVALHFGQSATRIHGNAGRATAVETAQGLRLPADLVVYGIGVLPNVELAQDAGLDIANGIRVNAQLQTSDPSISAIGDAAYFPSPHSGVVTRLESVQNATDQARHVAACLVGKVSAYAALPWFWSDQAEMRLQIAGLSDGFDQQIELGDAASGALSVALFRQGRMIALESCNRLHDHLGARKLLARGALLTPEQVGASGFDFKAYEAATRVGVPVSPAPTAGAGVPAAL